MSIGVHCTSCTSDFYVTAEFTGKLIRCPACKEPVRVPEETPEPAQPKVSAPSTKAPKRANSSKSMKAASPRQKAKPVAARPVASRDRSYESRKRTAVEAPARRSAQTDVARRNRKRHSQGNFPVGLAVGLGVGIAGLLIAVGAVLLKDTDDSLIADSGTSPAVDASTDDARSDRFTGDVISPNQDTPANNIGGNSSLNNQPPP